MRVIGPVFWYDMVRVARRQPLALWRAGYGLALLAALFVLYVTALPEAWFGGSVKPKDAATFATSFFNVFTAVQFAAVFLITPALTANAVAEERANNTLTFLLTTHLTNREIMLGKLLTRLLQVGLLVLTGLPVLAIVQFLGGVEPNLVIATFAALAVTALSLGCLGIFCGVFVKKPQNSAWRAYQIVIGYLVLSLLSIWYWELPAGPRTAILTQRYYLALQSLRLGRVAAASTSPNPELTLFGHSLDWFNAPNPYYTHLRVHDLQTIGNSFDQALLKVSVDYAFVHAGLALLLGGLAVWRLRAVAAKQAAGITHKKRLILRPAPHPPVRDRPVLWKEVYCEAKPRQRWLRLFFGRWFFVASFFPAWFVIVLSLDGGLGFGELESRTLFLLRYVGTFVVGLVCLRVALHAARSIGGERDRQTLDSLLTTQLIPDEIVRDKWWGSLLAGRWVFIWLVVHWCLGMLPFALHPLALPVLIVETLVYAAFGASLGMYCAARFATTRKALTATLLIGLVGTILLPWGAGKFAGAVLLDGRPPPPPQARAYYSRQMPTPAAELTGLGLTPPWVLMRTVVPWTEYYTDWWGIRGFQAEEVISPALFGLSIYSLAAFVLLRAARSRFRRSLSGHVLRRRPIPRPNPQLALATEH